MAEYGSPPGNAWVFQFAGLNLRSSPDKIPPNKYASALNVRGYTGSSTQTRPGYLPFSTAGNNAITDIAPFAAIETDDLPIYLFRNEDGGIFASPGGNSVRVLAAANSNFGGLGATMLPYRPAQSSQSWMYVAQNWNYSKTMNFVKN